MTNNVDVVRSIMDGLGIKETEGRCDVTGFSVEVEGPDFRPKVTVERLLFDKFTEDGGRPRITERAVLLPVEEYEALTSVERIARVAHEINAALCVAFGDNSQKSWEDAEAWQRDSAIKGVQFAQENPDAPPSAQHDAWSADKVADGWVYGETKDAEKKTHPCLVPFDELPPEQQAKDYLFRQVVKSLSAS